MRDCMPRSGRPTVLDHCLTSVTLPLFLELGMNKHGIWRTAAKGSPPHALCCADHCAILYLAMQSQCASMPPDFHCPWPPNFSWRAQHPAQPA